MRELQIKRGGGRGAASRGRRPRTKEEKMCAASHFASNLTAKGAKRKAEKLNRERQQVHEGITAYVTSNSN